MGEAREGYTDNEVRGVVERVREECKGAWWAARIAAEPYPVAHPVVFTHRFESLTVATLLYLCDALAERIPTPATPGAANE